MITSNLLEGELNSKNRLSSRQFKWPDTEKNTADTWAEPRTLPGWRSKRCEEVKKPSHCRVGSLKDTSFNAGIYLGKSNIGAHPDSASVKYNSNVRGLHES